MRSCEVPVDGFGTLVVVLGLLEEVGGVTRSSGPPVLGKSGRLRRIRSSSRPCQTAVNSEQEGSCKVAAHFGIHTRPEGTFRIP